MYFWGKIILLNIRKFYNWKDDIYKIKFYYSGDYCWNGPQRAVQVK